MSGRFITIGWGAEKMETILIIGLEKAMAKIGNDINYSSELLNDYFRCTLCRYPLLMFGCDNPSCKNYWKNNIQVKKKIRYDPGRAV